MSAESKTRMTEGSISKKMILFAIPLFLGNLFQQLYNTADSLIVGNFLGSNALGIVLIGRITADLCKDAGESAIASGVELAVKTAVLLTALPLLNRLLSLLREVLLL